MVELVSDFTVCRAGDTLTPQQAALLRAFGQKQSVFKMGAVAKWDSESCEVELLDEEFVQRMQQAGETAGLEGFQLGEIEFREA